MVSDYRAAPRRGMGAPIPAGEITYVDDGLAVVDYAGALPYADKSRITVYGVSLGGNLGAHPIARGTVHAAVLGAPAEERWKNATIDEEMALKNIQSIQAPVPILAGTADGLIHADRIPHDRLARAGRKEPLLDATLDALEKTLAFARDAK